MKIYVIQVSPGNEKKVQMQLERDEIQAFVPMREMIIRRNGMWVREIKTLFPSYVFVECEFSPEIFHKTRSVEDVLKWLGKPTPIKNKEENFMRLMWNGGEIIGISTGKIYGGKCVKITGGWLMGKENFIAGYDFRKKRVYLEIAFDGKIHRTSVSAEFTKE